ncbi:MAG: hypothetical protein J0I77_14610 [Rudaea sp.]|uniref:hypothetical protein n=1 Tax=unclassified Rudaea TaxID=2627037 RepID=UPI0010F8C676|nr:MULTISPECIES: hypothetical protein [unclassified Rudaea]MBN8886950.1 hypothetical protein [Rudaea sp.]MBR0346446.1 hypothetical protein [Rudaea sp.]
MTEANRPSRLATWLEAAWLERYLDRQLDAEEEAWFEAYVIDKPELLQKIDADSDLRDGLADAGAGMAAWSATGDNVEMFRPVDAGRTQRRRHGWQGLVMAACLLLGVGGGWLAQRIATPDGGGPALIVDPVLIRDYGTMRGGGSAIVTNSGKNRSGYVLVEVAVPQGAQDLQLRIVGLKSVAVQRSDEGFVTFLLSSDRLDQPIELTYSLGAQRIVQPVRTAPQNGS